MLHPRRPVRFRRGVSIRIDRQVQRLSWVESVVRERLILIRNEVQQPVDLGYAVPRERGDARGRDVLEAL